MRKLLVLSSFLIPSLGLAAEGMWTLDRLPTQAIAQQYGFTPDAAWTDKVMHASVRIAGGCSASFVSPTGLVLSNHHCALSCVEQLSSIKKDFVKDGFLAATPAQEVRCPEIELNRLDRITDVTKEVKTATAGLSGGAFRDAQNAVKARLTAACAGDAKATTRCEVVDLYHGGRYDLYQYHRYQDVRLVFVPEKSLGFFGGDPDNFNFPRYAIDMSLLRAYENGKPAVVKDYFPFNPAGAQEGELTFVTGNPGRTQRLLTVAQLETQRDTVIEHQLLSLAQLRGILTQYSAESPEKARVAATDLFGIENSFKARLGQLQALQDPVLMAQKRQEEADLRAFVAKDPTLASKAGGAWDAIAKAQTVYREIEPDYLMKEVGLGFNSQYFRIARNLVRGADERALPDQQRMPEFNEAALPQLEQRLFSSAPLYPDFERVKLTASLTRLREILGTDDPFVKQVLGKQSPADLARQLTEGTQLADVARRKALWDGGKAAIAASDDPMIKLARLVDPAARAVRLKYENDVDAVEQKNAELIAQARFAQLGDKVYPDATFTMRLSYGEVRGWSERGQPVPPFTHFAGLYDRATGAEPFALPQSWITAKPKLDPQQRMNFVTTNDIIGGNSGSPVINRQGQIVGLVFDGNIHSLGGAFYYDPVSNRTVAVHSGAILQALKYVYGADQLVQELTVPATH
ncbi:S46 family peptidase [Silvimonas iriomotensis]|uniref:Dipeptidyl-peptidase n=1 Tax=Silvimonas iriomotensis TaxID=449662 RepID=A0ABQ2PCZ8_9NEIS|nr:S46 family peptidase [Silvimonas iriomotensis]GGP23419.1 dipeptidyl-peptidase [Silvimonas iriomotensis]